MALNYFKNLTNKKKAIWGLTITLIIFTLFYIFNLPSSPIPPSSPTVTPPPPPSPNPQLVISQQRTNFTWNTSLPSNTPTHLPFYTITQPLLDSTTILPISTYFDFKTQHQINTETTDYLWVNNQLSLFASPSQQILTYNNANPEPNLPSPDQQTFITQSNQIINQLFPSTNFKINPLSSTKKTPLISILNYSQTINDYFIITPTVSQSTLTIALNNQFKIQYLEILGGYQQTTPSESFEIISSQTKLKEVAPSRALRLHTTYDVSQESSIDQSSTINFTVNNITLVYYQPDASSTLYPSFLLQGNLKTNSISLENASFIIPAF